MRPSAARLARPTILAMGGGGFTMEPENPALDRFVLALTDKPQPKICLLPTASGDPDHQIQRFYDVFGDLDCEPSHISLFRLGANPVPLRETLLAQDAIYVGGGSMVNLLAIWRAQGLDAILREAWTGGIVLAGLSAGAMCWFQWGISKGVGHCVPVEGLGFLPGSFSVHHDGEPERPPVYRALIGAGTLPGGYSADDGAALLFRGTRLAKVVASRPHAKAYRVTKVGDDVLQDPMEAHLLPHRRRIPFDSSPAVSELRRTLAAQRARERSARGH